MHKRQRFKMWPLHKNTLAGNLVTCRIIGKTQDFNFVGGQLQSGHL